MDPAVTPATKLTIRDIARLAGVSRSTVSLVINDDPRISKETKTRVNSVIAEAGYRPNSQARSLARQRADAVAVVLPRTQSHLFADFYFAEAISGISAALSEAGFRLLIEIAEDNAARPNQLLSLYRERGVDGMLLLGTTDKDTYVQDLIEARVPVVLVNSRRDGAASVLADNRQGMAAMVRHLCEVGHRRIGFIGGLEETTVGADRSIGFEEGLRDSGIPFDPDLRLWGNFSETSGCEVARELLGRPNPPTALVAANDMMAIGALRVAQEELGMVVPKDLTVVGADDVRLTTYVRPKLTTLAQDIFEIGRLATRCLLQALEAKTYPSGVEIVPTRLQVRGSSGPPGS